MQLILNTETAIDLKRNMSTLDKESQDEKLDDVIQELKTDICNSNKENIHSQDNIITANDVDFNLDGDKEINEEITENKTPLPYTIEDNATSNSVSNEDVPSEVPTQLNDDEAEKDEESDPIIISHVEDTNNSEKIEEIENSHETHIEKNISHMEVDIETISRINNTQEHTNTDHKNESAALENVNIVSGTKSDEDNINSLQKDSNPVQGSVNTVEEATNTINEATDTIEETTNTINEDTNTPKKDTNINEDTNINSEDKNMVVENTNTHDDENTHFVDKIAKSDEKPLNSDQKHVHTVLGKINDTEEGDNTVQEEICHEDTTIVRHDTNIVLDINTVQEETGTVPEDTSIVPENTSIVPEDTSIVPEDTSIVPEDTSIIPEDTSIVPEDTSIIPEDTSIVPEDTNIVSKDTDTVDEEKYTVQEDRNAVQENKVSVPETISDVQNDMTNIQETKNTVQEIINDDILENEDISMEDNDVSIIDDVETVDLVADEILNCTDKLSDLKHSGQNIINIDVTDGILIDDSDEIPVKEITQIPLSTETPVEEMEIDISKENDEISENKETKAIPVNITNVDIEEIEVNKYTEHLLECSVKDNDIEMQSDTCNLEKQKINSMECDNTFKTVEIVEKKLPSDSNGELDVRNAGEQNIKHVEESETPNQLSTISELKIIPSVLKLSNTLDILSDDDEAESSKTESQDTKAITPDKQCINIEDDDDIMLIDEDMDSKDVKNNQNTIPCETKPNLDQAALECQDIEKSLDVETVEQIVKEDPADEKTVEIEVPPPKTEVNDATPALETIKPLVPNNFLKGFKKNLADMTREDLEEFCILKIVESIVDRSNLSEIKSKLKTMAQNTEEYKKKAMMLTKQNRDLQVVLKSVQEEQKKTTDAPITPLKITRSVGMQVLMTEKAGMRRKAPLPTQAPVIPNNSNNKTSRSPNPATRPVKAAPTPQTIPVPRLVPASNTVVKTPIVSQNNTNNSVKAASPLNGVKNSPPVIKLAEKRTRNQNQSITVDLTDDEPPSKVLARNSPAPTPGLRVVPAQNMLAPQRHPLGQNSPRKVYIPISGQQSQNIRPGQTIMLKTVTPQAQGPRPRVIAPPATPRMPINQIRMSRVQNRHPAPLPEVKQYQTNHYKALPPAPDLKLSKVENGIVISWKIEGYQQESYEEIASYQLYAYQETTSPPSTSLWKKIGDVKALPLPMACTLTQFMAGFKYYFAVRAVDIRSRYGPFSLPGSIILLNKI